MSKKAKLLRQHDTIDNVIKQILYTKYLQIVPHSIASVIANLKLLPLESNLFPEKVKKH